MTKHVLSFKLLKKIQKLTMSKTKMSKMLHFLDTGNIAKRVIKKYQLNTICYQNVTHVKII